MSDRIEQQIKNISKAFKSYAENYGRLIVAKERMEIEKCKLKTEHFITQNPLKAVAGGLISGYIIGKIFSND